MRTKCFINNIPPFLIFFVSVSINFSFYCSLKTILLIPLSPYLCLNNNILTCFCPISIHCSTEIIEKFISGFEPQTKCNIHQSYQIDIRNGLLAGKNCPKEFVTSRVYEIYPALYNNWVAKQCIPRPSQRFSNLREEKPASLSDEDTLYIAFPDEGDIFCIYPVLRLEYQTISLKEVIPKGIKNLI